MFVWIALVYHWTVTFVYGPTRNKAMPTFHNMFITTWLVCGTFLGFIEYIDDTIFAFK